MTNQAINTADIARTTFDQLSNLRGNWADPYTLDVDGLPKAVRLRGNVEKATLPEHREWQRANPALTSLYRYQGPGSFGTGDYHVGAGIRNLAGGDNAWKRNFRRGPFLSTLGGGLVGAAGGSAIGALIGLLRGDIGRHASLGALAGSALLGGLAGQAGYRYKQSSFGGRQQVLEALKRDPALSTGEKLRLSNALGSLSTRELQDLIRRLGTAGGAGIGALVARFLLDRGRGGMLIGAVTGGVIARNVLDKKNRNAFGQRTTPGLNVFGTRM